MNVEGGCFCGKIRYRSEGKAAIKGLCHCRQCQYIAGGGPNNFVAVPTAGFAYTKDEPKIFARPMHRSCPPPPSSVPRAARKS